MKRLSLCAVSNSGFHQNIKSTAPAITGERGPEGGNLVGQIRVREPARDLGPQHAFTVPRMSAPAHDNEQTALTLGPGGGDGFREMLPSFWPRESMEINVLFGPNASRQEFLHLVPPDRVFTRYEGIVAVWKDQGFGFCDACVLRLWV